jgi:hypothetical protein
MGQSHAAPSPARESAFDTGKRLEETIENSYVTAESVVADEFGTHDCLASIKKIAQMIRDGRILKIEYPSITTQLVQKLTCQLAPAFSGAVRRGIQTPSGNTRDMVARDYTV